MSIAYLFVWIVIFILAASSVWALIWAITTGQFVDFQEGARSIFDEDEPVGVTTDHFPANNKESRQKESDG